MLRYNLQRSQRARSYHNHGKTAKELREKMNQHIRNCRAEGRFFLNTDEGLKLLESITLHQCACNLFRLISQKVDHDLIDDYKEYLQTSENKGIKRNLFFEKLDKFISDHRKNSYETEKIYKQYDKFVAQNKIKADG